MSHWTQRKDRTRAFHCVVTSVDTREARHVLNAMSCAALWTGLWKECWVEESPDPWVHAGTGCEVALQKKETERERATAGPEGEWDYLTEGICNTVGLVWAILIVDSLWDLFHSMSLGQGLDLHSHIPINEYFHYLLNSSCVGCMTLKVQALKCASAKKELPYSLDQTPLSISRRSRREAAPPDALKEIVTK